MTTLIESMHKFSFGEYSIRVWREEPPDYEWSEDDVSQFNGGLPLSDIPYSKTQIAAGILALPKVNAVEVLDREGNGVVFYNNWP